MSTGRRDAVLAADARMSELGMTQAELARAARVDLTTVNAFLNGRNWPQSRTRARLEVALQWPTGMLARIAAGEQPPNPPPADPLQIKRLLLEYREDLAALRTRNRSTYDVIAQHLRREITSLERTLESLQGSHSE